MADVKDLPHDFLAEKATIGSLLIDNRAFDEITDIQIKSEDFYNLQYATIYKAIEDLAIQDKPFDLISVCAQLNDVGKLETLGGESFVANLIEDTISSANIYHYAKIVKNKATLREIIRNSMRISDQGRNFSGDIKEFIDEVESSFFSLASQTRTNFVTTLKDALRVNLKNMEAGKKEDGKILGMTTGFKTIDEKLLGLQAGQMVIIAARPGMGKTALAVNLGVNACKATNKPIMFYSYEMLSPELSGRMLSSEANVDSRKLRTNDFNDMDMRNIATAIKGLSGLPIFINDSGATTLLDIKSQARKVKSDQGLGMIIIDYLQLMQSHVNKSSREQEIAEISRGIKELAKELECPIIALSQLNRSATSRTDRRPQLQDLRESGSIEQDADIVILIHREEYYDENSPKKGIAEVIIAKNRAGQPGTVEMAWVASQTKFTDLQRPAHENAGQ